MLRSRLVCVSALTAAVLPLGGCMMAPIGTTDNSGAISPYTSYPGYPSGTIPAPVTPGNYQGRGQVVNVQTLQSGGATSVPGSGAIIGGLAGGCYRQSDCPQRPCHRHNRWRRSWRADR